VSPHVTATCPLSTFVLCSLGRYIDSKAYSVHETDGRRVRGEKRDREGRRKRWTVEERERGDGRCDLSLKCRCLSYLIFSEMGGEVRAIDRREVVKNIVAMLSTMPEVVLLCAVSCLRVITLYSVVHDSVGLMITRLDLSRLAMFCSSYWIER
jgi:hypothetical protein